jgi:hypothetical protein
LVIFLEEIAFFMMPLKSDDRSERSRKKKRRTQFLEDLRNKRYWELKEEAED